MRRRTLSLLSLVLLSQLMIFAVLYYNLAAPPSLSPHSHGEEGDQNNGLKRKLHVKLESQLALGRDFKNDHGEKVHYQALLNHSSPDSTSISDHASQIQTGRDEVKKNTVSRETMANHLRSEEKSHVISNIKSTLPPERLKRLKPQSMLQGMDSEKRHQSTGDQEQRIRSNIRDRDEKIIQESLGLVKQLKPKQKTDQKSDINDVAEDLDVLVNGKKKSEGKFSVRKTLRDTERERVKEMDRLWKERNDIQNKKATKDKLKRELVKNIKDYSKFKSEDYFKEVCESTQEPLVECSETLPERGLDQFEANGKNIMYTIRTTFKYHDVRLPDMMDTWLGETDPDSVFIVTDADDENLEWKTNTLGMNYVNIRSGRSHNRSDLCCKAGVELELLMLPEYSNFNWVCHIDDDMYVNPGPLARTLSQFKPAEEKVYLGRSGSTWGEPWMVKEDSLISTPGKRYHFAVGGMYCLSRAMLEAARQYLVGCKAFEKSCSDSKEPEDVTVGLIIGAVLDLRLHRTEMIYTHGLDLLSSTPTPYLKEQIAFSYGFGTKSAWTVIPNVVYVPGGLFNIDEDVTQFKSLHCHLHPRIDWCLDKKKEVVEDKKKRENNSKNTICECSWKKIICCNVYKENHARFIMEGRKTKQKEREEEKEKEKEKEEKEKEKEMVREPEKEKEQI